MKFSFPGRNCTAPYMREPIRSADIDVPIIANVRIAPKFRKKYFCKDQSKSHINNEMVKATRRTYPFEGVSSVENLQREHSHHYYCISSKRKIRLRTIGGNMILKNISGSKIAFKSISFSFLSST